MPRPNRSVAGLCIAVIVLAAFLPGIFVLDLAVLEPHRVLLPDEICTLVCTALRPGDEQPYSLLSLLPSRAPPSHPLA